MIATIFRTHTTVPVTVEARHGLLGEEGERFLKDYWRERTWLALYYKNSWRVRRGSCAISSVVYIVCWYESREWSPFRLLLLGLVAMLKAARRVKRKSGSMKMSQVVKE